jgi:hypothetical protein
MAEASFTLKAVDATAQAFASVQNNLHQLKNTSNEAGRALAKNLDVKDVMRSLAFAIGLSADKIANKIAELATGQTEEVVKLQEELVKASDETFASAVALQKVKNTDLINLKLMQLEERRLSEIIAQKPTTLEEQVKVQKAVNNLNLVQIQLAGIYGKQWDEVVAGQDEYNKLRREFAETEMALRIVRGGTIDKAKLYNDLTVREIKIKDELNDVDTWTIEGIKLQNDLKREQIEINKQLIPLEQDRRKLSMDAGQAIAQSFEDAILSGKKLGEVVRDLGQDLLRLVFRQQITQPLAEGIGKALFSGFGARAMGGPVSSGSPYMVGEKGPELFVPSSSGSIVPNGSMGSSGGGSGGVTVNYNIAAGVSRAELVPILEQERRRLKAEIPDMVRRGGSYRSAFA